MCGALASTLSSRDTSPVSTCAISARIASIASQKRSSSRFDSLSVGSIMSVSATGNDIVGAWKPKSTSRFATSSTVTPLDALTARRSMMLSCATNPLAPVYRTGNVSPV